MEEAGTCLRCGAPYETGATVCLKCGAPIGETQTPTQPVRALNVPRVTNAPAPASQPAQASAASMPLAAPVAAAAPHSGAATPTPPPPASGKRRLGIVGIALVSLLALIVLGGIAYTVRALTAAPPVANQTIYRDPQHRFHFQRPALWLVTPTTDGVTLSDSDGASTAKIDLPSLSSPATAKAYADQLATQNNLTATLPQQIAGETWEQRLGQVTGADGAVREVVVFVTLHNDHLYVIQFTCPVASYDSINNLVYQPLLASFAFD